MGGRSLALTGVSVLVISRLAVPAPPPPPLLPPPPTHHPFTVPCVCGNTDSASVMAAGASQPIRGGDTKRVAMALKDVTTTTRGVCVCVCVCALCLSRELSKRAHCVYPVYLPASFELRPGERLGGSQPVSTIAVAAKSGKRAMGRRLLQRSDQRVMGRKVVPFAFERLVKVLSDQALCTLSVYILSSFLFPLSLPPSLMPIRSLSFSETDSFDSILSMSVSPLFLSLRSLSLPLAPFLTYSSTMITSF